MQYARRNKRWIIDTYSQNTINYMCWSLIDVYAFKWVIWIPFAVFYVYLFYFIGLSYILKSSCYLWNTHIFMNSYQLNHIAFFNSSNRSYHFKLMGCSSLPWPHRYRHKSHNEPVTKVTTIHFTPERNSPPVNTYAPEIISMNGNGLINSFGGNVWVNSSTIMLLWAH